MEFLVNLLTNNTDSLIASANFTISLMMSLMVLVVSHQLLKRTFPTGSGLRIVLWGVLLEAIGWACHRFYWGMWRLGRENGWPGWNEWFVNNGWIALVPVSIIIFGLAIIFIPVWRTVSKRDDFIVPPAIAFCVFWFFFWALDTDQISLQGPPDIDISRPVN